MNCILGQSLVPQPGSLPYKYSPAYVHELLILTTLPSSGHPLRQQGLCIYARFCCGVMSGRSDEGFWFHRLDCPLCILPSPLHRPECHRSSGHTRFGLACAYRSAAAPPMSHDDRSRKLPPIQLSTDALTRSRGTGVGFLERVRNRFGYKVLWCPVTNNEMGESCWSCPAEIPAQWHNIELLDSLS